MLEVNKKKLAMRSPKSLVYVENGKDGTLSKITDFCTVLNFSTIKIPKFLPFLSNNDNQMRSYISSGTVECLVAL